MTEEGQASDAKTQRGTDAWSLERRQTVATAGGRIRAHIRGVGGLLHGDVRRPRPLCRGRERDGVRRLGGTVDTCCLAASRLNRVRPLCVAARLGDYAMEAPPCAEFRRAQALRHYGC